MCMEDVRIGRETSTQSKAVTIPSATWTKVCEQVPGRYSVRFLVKGNVGVILVPFPSQPPVTPTDFGGASPSDSPYDLQHHGDMVTQPWWCYQSLGNVTVWVTEVYLARE